MADVSAPTEPVKRRARRRGRGAAGAPSRFVVAGAAVGSGLALVGAMAAASSSSVEPSSQVVVVLEPVADQIVVVIPSLEPGTPIQATATVVRSEPSVVPPRSADPPTQIARTQAPPPVAETGGS